MILLNNRDMSDIISIVVDNLTSLIASGGYWILSIVVILEGLPIVGSFFPGHVLIISAGFLAKLGVLNLGMVLVITIVGTVIGDVMGFLIGRRYGYAFLQKYGKYAFIKEEHIEKAKRLIDNHTGKAIILGKISPVTRSLTPFIVGASGIHIKRFWPYNIIGSFWSIVSIMIGYIFGSSYHIGAEYFGKFIFLALVITVLVVWGYRFINVRFHIFKKYELFALGLNIIFLFILAKTIQDTLSANSFMANFDISVNLFMVQYVGPSLARVGSIISMVGGTEVMTGLSIIFSIIFLLKKRWRTLAIILISFVSTVISLKVMKELFMRSRPDDALQILSDPSFPSGHAGLSAVFFFVMVYIFVPRIRSWVIRESFIVFSVIAVFLIGLSRIVLNVHWASDVIAGWSLGIFIATCSILFVRYVGAFFVENR